MGITLRDVGSAILVSRWHWDHGGHAVLVAQPDHSLSAHRSQYNRHTGYESLTGNPMPHFVCLLFDVLF